MTDRYLCGALLLTAVCAIVVSAAGMAPACCPAPPFSQPVVNADQTVIIIWDAATKTQHFIRKASFQSEADNFGFLIPSPSQPELSESGDDAFPNLLKLTEPEVENRPRPVSIGCSCSSPAALGPSWKNEVRVLEEKTVAGFHAAVLDADSAAALVTWLKSNGYAYSPEVEAWAKPYVDAGWKITALKVAKDAEGKTDKAVAASSLRMSFKTDRPVFPYREPDTKSAADALGAKSRLLRIFFIAEAKYRGELTRETPWTGQVVWANKLTAEQRIKTLEMLKLPENTGPRQWWLTEFEDAWPYKLAPADVYFSRDPDQSTRKRPPMIQFVAAPLPTDVTVYAIAAMVLLPPLVRRAVGARHSRSSGHP
jgi:Uncharacterized protein conserved in bacteria (DUF2330)